MNYTLVQMSYRLKMYSFWNDESRLSADTLSRLTQLLAVLYSTATERQFLYHSTNLLLELTSRSPDFNRSVFDDPLSECKFEVCQHSFDSATVDTVVLCCWFKVLLICAVTLVLI